MTRAASSTMQSPTADGGRQFACAASSRLRRFAGIALARGATAIAGALLAFGLLGATPAVAGVGGAVGPTWPTSVTVGQAFSGYIDIWNMSNGNNASEFVLVTSINFTPSCSAGSGGTCTAPDPGVFSFASPIGMPGTACSGIVFSVQAPNPTTGEVALVPNKTLRLGPADRSGGAQSPPNCRIVINATVLKMPQDSNTATPEVTTLQFARASLMGEVSRATGSALGQATVTVIGPGASLAASGGNAQVVLGWSTTPAGATYTHKLVFATGAAPASCSTGTVLLNNSTATAYTHTGRTNGTTYYYRLCSTESASGSVVTDTASATPQAANQPPVADAGPDKSAQTLTSITFDGSGSTDPDNNIATYAWNFGDGTSATGKTVAHAYATAGTYTATLTVTDASGASSSNTASVTITNRPPVANAGPDQSALTLSPVSFSASGSSDPDGSIASYAWNFGDGASGTGSAASHSYASSGVYTVTLTVTDNKGATASDTATVTINNRAPAANAGPDQTAQTLSLLSFNGSGSSDPDGSIVSYAWNFGDGTSGTGSATSHSYATAGSYTVTLTVTDNKGATGGDTASVTIMNRAPVANAGPDQSATVGSAVALSGAGSADQDGTIASYAWDFGDGSTFNGGGSPAASHAYSAPGTYTVTLTVTDNLGAPASDTATVTVTNGTASSGAFKWASRFGSSTSIVTVGHGTAVDGAGNVIIVGEFSGTIDFGGGPLTSAGGSDIFVLKLDSSGGHVWSKRFGGAINDAAYAVAVDSSGNVIVAGSYMGTINFGGGNMTAPGVAGRTDAFVAKFSPTGSYLWAKGFGGGGDDGAYGVAVDGNGNVVFTGCFTGNALFGSLVLEGRSSVASDAFLAKLTPAAGDVSWAKNFGGTGIDCGEGVGTDAGGNITMIGSFMGPADFGGGAGSLPGIGLSDIVLARYSSSGTHLWSKQIGGTTGDEGFAVAVAANGDAAVTGYVQGTVDFGGGNTSTLGLLDTFVAKYSAAGAHQWSRRLGGGSSEQGFGIAMDANGNVFLAGSFQGSAEFGTGVLNSEGSSDIVAAKFSSTGTPLWAKSFGDTDIDDAYAVATDSNGNAVFTGRFHGIVDFGGGELTSAGWTDLFVVKFGP